MADGDQGGNQGGQQQGQQQGGQQQAAWHTGIEADLIGVAQSKGWKLDDPKEAFGAATKAYREAQKLLGVPADQLIRVPAASAPEADVKAYLTRIGVPAEAKEYDLSGVKSADGSDLDQAFSDTLRVALLAGRVPKDTAPTVVKAVVKHLDDQKAAEAALVSGNVQRQETARKQNWGANDEANFIVARNAFLRVAAAAGMDPAAAQKEANDRFKAGSGMNAVTAEMWRVIGSKIGEDKFVQMGGTGSGNLPMTREAAKAEIAALKNDPEFGKRYTAGGAVETQRMNALHQIAFAPSQAA